MWELLQQGEERLDGSGVKAASAVSGWPGWRVIAVTVTRYRPGAGRGLAHHNPGPPPPSAHQRRPATSSHWLKASLLWWHCWWPVVEQGEIWNPIRSVIIGIRCTEPRPRVRPGSGGGGAAEGGRGGSHLLARVPSLDLLQVGFMKFLLFAHIATLYAMVGFSDS